MGKYYIKKQYYNKKGLDGGFAITKEVISMKRAILNKYLNNQKGMALAVVVMIFAVVSILAATSLTISLSQTKQSVAAENYTEAYYLARSATDVVSTDIINQINELNDSIPNPSSSAIEISKYNALQAKIDSILTTSNVIVNGIGSNSIQSNIVVVPSGLKKFITVETVYQNEGRTGRAKVQLGKISTEIQTITQSGINTNAIYTWGNLDIGTGLTVTGGGEVGYGGTAIIGNNANINANNSVFPVNIITPPTLDTITDQAILLSEKNGGSFPVKNINKLNNGNYGSLTSTDNNTSINWNVDTSSGDVILVFNSLSLVSSEANINVTGNNDNYNLYIYLMEDPAKNNSVKSLLYFKNDFNITGKNTTGAPKTYIIAYTKAMQAEDNMGKTVTENSELDPYDTAYIKNSAQLDAFFYLPGCDFEIEQGNPVVTGSMFSSDFTLGNTAKINFKPYLPNSALGTQTSMGETFFTIKKMDIEKADLNNTNINKVWIK